VFYYCICLYGINQITNNQMENKLVDDWWNQGLNPITGMRTETRGDSRYGTSQDEVKYFNAYPKLETKCTTF